MRGYHIANLCARFGKGDPRVFAPRDVMRTALDQLPECVLGVTAPPVQGGNQLSQLCDDGVLVFGHDVTPLGCLGLADATSAKAGANRRAMPNGRPARTHARAVELQSRQFNVDISNGRQETKSQDR